MEIKDLINSSPLRAFEEDISGGLGRGNLGVLVSRHGVGKTACLVHLATDKLFRGENVIHVSFSENVEHVVSWYKEVFREISEKRSLEEASEIFNNMLSKRIVTNFSQANVSVDKVLSSLGTLITAGSFKADCILFDGYKLTLASDEDVRKLKQFAVDMKLEIWFSVSPARPDVVIDQYGVPNTMEKYRDYIDVLVGLRYSEKDDRVLMTVVKDHDKSPARPMSVALDPRTMLISK